MRTSRFSAEQIIGILKELPRTLTRGARRQAVAWARRRRAPDDDELRRRLH